MLTKLFAIGALVAAGVIAADFVAHPAGTTAVAKGTAGILTPTYNALLGQPTK